MVLATIRKYGSYVTGVARKGKLLLKDCIELISIPILRWRIKRDIASRRDIGIDEPKGQPESQLLRLPGELRNQIYTTFFTKSTKAHLDLLLTCRQIYFEARMPAFQAITFEIRQRGGSISQICRTWQTLPSFLRCASNIVYTNEDVFMYTVIPMVTHYVGLYPVNFEHRCLSSGWFGGRGFWRTIRSAAQDWLTIDSEEDAEDCLEHGALFGQFLDNPRLQSWSCTTYSEGRPQWEIKASRIEVVATKHKRMWNPPRHSSGRLDYEWFKELKVEDYQPEGEAGYYKFSVTISHSDATLQPAHRSARVRFSFVDYS